MPRIPVHKSDHGIDYRRIWCFIEPDPRDLDIIDLTLVQALVNGDDLREVITVIQRYFFSFAISVI